jgi:hypothetical protein
MIASGQADSRASHRGANLFATLLEPLPYFPIGRRLFFCYACLVITGQDHARQCPRPMLRSLPVSLESKARANASLMAYRGRARV